MWKKKEEPINKPIIKERPLDAIFGTSSEKAEPESSDTICINCKHHNSHELEEGDGNEHNCFANANEEVNYVTGDRHWVDVEDCEDINGDGDCSDYEKA